MADPGNTDTGGKIPRPRTAGAATTAVAPRRSDRSPWNWLLIIPIVLPLLTFLFNGKSPTLFGFPRFYWLQLAFVLVGVVATTVVYQATKDRG